MKKIQDIFNIEPPELFIQTIKVKDYSGEEKEFQHIPIEKARYMLNDKLDSWSTKNFYISRPYLFEGQVLVDSSCELYGEVEHEGKIYNFNYVGASTFCPKDFKGNKSLAQIGLAEDIKNGMKNLGRYFGRDLNPSLPDTEMLLEIVNGNTKPKKSQPSVSKAVNGILKAQEQK